MATLEDITSNPDALKDFNTLPRVERVKVITQIDPTFKDLKLQDRFEVLNHIEGMGNKTPDNKPLSTSQQFMEVGKQAIGSTPPALIAKGGKAISELPSQIGGATGVGLQTKSLERARAALSPEFQPKEGEKLGYYGGQIAGIFAGAPLEAKAADIALAPTARTTGKMIEGLETAKGISQRLPSMPKDIRGYVNNVHKALDEGRQLSLQELADAEERLSTIIKNEPGKLASLLGTKSELGTKGKALASAAKKEVTDLLHKAIEGRAKLFEQYGDAKQRSNIIKSLGAAAIAAAASQVSPTIRRVTSELSGMGQ